MINNALLQMAARGGQSVVPDAFARGAQQGNALRGFQQEQEKQNALQQIAQAYAQGGPQAAAQVAGQTGQFDAVRALDQTQYRRGRDQAGDQRFERQFDYRQGRDQVGDQFRQQQIALQRAGLAQRSQKPDPNAAFSTRAAAAQQFGLQPNTPEFQNYVLTGKMPKPSVSASGGKPTAASKKSAGYYNRALAADQILNDENVAKAALSRFNKYGNEGIDPLGPFGPRLSIPREYQDENFLKFDQAQRDFVNAILRPESGAVINPDEFENAKLQYFPQPGDPQSIIDQKAANRAAKIEGLRIEAEASLGDPAKSDSWQDLGNGVRIRQKGQ